MCIECFFTYEKDGKAFFKSVPDENGVNDLLYRSLAKPLLFKMDPEQAHHLIIGGLSGMGSIRPVPSGLRVMYGVRETEDLAVDMFGCHFLPPVGLAAGLDKTDRL